MHARALVLALPLCLLGACNDTDEGQVGGGGGGGGAPSLTSADFPAVSPCPNQDILTDAAQFAAFRTALLNGTFLYLDVPFDAGDADIFRKKCGLNTFWNPVDNVDEIAPAATPVTISDLFVTGNAGICAAGFNNSSFGTGEGFPVAGTYRKEFKVTDMGVTYLVRTRVSVTGSAAGDTFMSRGITVPGDLEMTLSYRVDGVPALHDDVLVAITNALQSPDAMTILDVLDMAGGTTILTALIEVICVEIL